MLGRHSVKNREKNRNIASYMKGTKKEAYICAKKFNHTVHELR